jgi:hypothetical protein
MAFPTSPIDGELYTNALGTQYQYVLADTAWKIVNGGGGGTVKGSGTVGTLAKFVTDSTSIGDSVLTEDSGNIHTTGNFDADGTISSVSGESIFQQLRVQGTTQSILTTYQPDTSSYSFVRCLAEAPDTEIDLISFGSTMTGTSGPDGGSQAGGVCLEGIGNFMEINQQQSGMKMHLSYRHASKIIVDTTGAMITNIRPISGTTVYLEGSEAINQTGVASDSSSILQILDSRASGASWNAIDLRDILIEHGCTNVMPSTNSYGAISQHATGTNYGGLQIRGASDSANASGIVLNAISDDPGSAYPVMMINLSCMDGADSSFIPDAAYALIIKNNSVAKVYFMGNGATGVGMLPTAMFAVAGLNYYVDNAAALSAGLSPGDFYRSGTDPAQVCVVITAP